MAALADGIVRHDVENEVLCAVVGDLVRFARLENECVARFDRRRPVLVPDDAFAQNNLGKALFAAGRVDEAIPLLQRAAAHCDVFESPFALVRASLWLGEALLYQAGTPQPFDAAALSRFMKQNRELRIRLQFTLGSGRCTFWTCDLTYDYVRLNADYTT